MEQLKSIYQAVLDGDQAGAHDGVQAALAAGIAPDMVLNQGLIAAMTEVGRLFEAGEYYVPEMLVAARAMQAGLALLKPLLARSGVPPAGRVVIGTVQGDLHDIGKNLVAMMLEGAGFEIVDLGTDVSPDKFVAAVREHTPDILGMSALLTTTMPAMGKTVQALRDAGVRDRVKVIIGGAPVTTEFAQKIGADCFSPDASAAARMARTLVA